MEKQDFYDILIKYSPEEIREYIQLNGKVKFRNAIAFINNKEENNNEQNK